MPKGTPSSSELLVWFPVGLYIPQEGFLILVTGPWCAGILVVQRAIRQQCQGHDVRMCPPQGTIEVSGMYILGL